MDVLFFIIGLIIVVINIVSQLSKTKQKNLPPLQQDTTSEKAPNSKEMTLEDLFRQFTEPSEKSLEQTTKKKKRPDAIEDDRSLENAINYEEMGMQNYETVNYEDPTRNFQGLTKKDLKDEHLNPYSKKRGQKKNKFLKLLRNKNSVKEAIIMNEILKRRVK